MLASTKGYDKQPVIHRLVHVEIKKFHTAILFTLKFIKHKK